MDAYSLACEAAHLIVAQCIDSLTERIRSGEIVDEDDLPDAIHEEVDSVLTYTRDQYALAWGLRDEEDAIEEGLCRPSNFGEALSAQAYCNLRAAIESHDFSDAFAVASDAALESEVGES